jgi:hypothetical protein
MNIRKRLTDAWFGVFVVLWCVFIAGMLTITSCVSFSEQKRDLLLENYALVVQEFEAQRVDKVALLNLLKSKTTNPESLDEITVGLMDAEAAKERVGLLSKDVEVLLNSSTLDAEQQAFILEILQLVLPPEDE